MAHTKRPFTLNTFLAAIFLILGILAIGSTPARAAVAQLINYQGKLTATNGYAVADGNYDMRFKLYDAASSGNLLWTGTHTAANGNAVAVSRGLFSILLGSGTGNALIDFNADTYYLQVEIYNTATTSWKTFSNRKRIGAVPQALNAKNLVSDGFIDIDATATAQDAANISYNPASGSQDALEVTYGAAGGTGTALKVTQSGTGIAVDLVSSSSAANAINITANSIDAETGVSVTANGLTSGKALTLASSASAFTGSLQEITLSGSSASNTGSLLTLSNTGTSNANTSFSIKHYATGTNNLALRIDDVSGDTTPFVVDGSGKVGIGLSAPTAYLHLAAGTTSANTAPLKFTSGSLMSAPEAGAVEFLSDAYYATITTGAARKTFAFLESPTFTGTVTLPSPFTVGATSVTATGTQLNYLNAASGTTGTTSTNLVFSASPNFTGTLGASAITASSALAANGGITFDAASDTVGAHTLSGTLDAGSNILTNIGNTGTDFVASTGALTLAGVLTANGGISLAGGQSLSAVALSYVDLGLITHSTTANQGLRLPNAASASPSNPTSGEGYIAWDASGNQIIAYNGTAWSALSGGGGYSLIKDEVTGLTARTTLAFLGSGVTCVDNASQTECTIAGGGSSDLQGTYESDADGSNATISLTSADDSIVVSNPASSGSDSTFAFKVEQLNAAALMDAFLIDNRGTGNGLRIDDTSGDTSPFIVDADGRVGVGTSTITGTTERLLQVGAATNRGNSATYGEVITKGLRQIQSLTNIRDVFVYDTSTDNDGGRWIDWATTDKLSWFTETLDDSPSTPCNISSMDRCYSDSFPRKAILVVTTNALYIFDATNGNMWMKFSQNASGYALGVDTNNEPSSVYALNGVVYVGANGSAAGGLYAIDFINDRMYNYDDTDRSQGNVGIGSRNTAVTYGTDNNTNLDLGANTGWKTVNDVSAAVMWGSTTTNAVNGVTMVAVATDSGLANINLSANKILYYSDQTDNDYQAVSLTRRGRLYGLNSTLGQAERWENIDTDSNVATRLNGTPEMVWDETTVPALSKAAPTIATNTPDALDVIERGSLSEDNSDIIYVGTSQGLTEIDDNVSLGTAPNKGTAGWSKFYNITEQTAFMPATIKGAFMFSQTAAPATDSSFRNNSLSAKGTVTFGGNGVRGLAITPNGTNGYLCNDQAADGTCETDADYRVGTAGFSIQLWFKHAASAPAAAQTLVDHTFAGANVGGYRVFMNTSGTIQFGIDDDATTFPEVSTTSTQTYLDNQWHHLVATRTNAAGNLTLVIDGVQVASTSVGATTASLETGGATAIFAIGATCNAAACASAAANSFWNGSIDDVTISAGGATTNDQLTQIQARRLYNDARPTLGRKVYNGAADTVSYTSTVITDSSTPGWLANELTGSIVKINSGSGIKQTRRIIANTTNTITVSPAFTTTPSSNDDFKVDPEALFGSSNIVKAVGVSKFSTLGEARMLCAGTSDGADGGGITCYNHQAGPNVIADVYHADAKQLDDNGVEWTGTDSNDIRSIDITTRTMIFGTDAHTWLETQDIRLGQAMDYIQSKLFDIRSELLADTITGTSLEVGLSGGADLAENYYSQEPLQAGEVVALDGASPAGVLKTTKAYQENALGVVATAPGIVLGQSQENAYPVALVGRVPVKVTNENGMFYAGDRLTASSRPGYAMRASQSGQTLGTVLSDAADWAVCEGEDPEDHKALLCTTVLTFVNLSDYRGETIEVAMNRYDEGLAVDAEQESASTGLANNQTSIRFGAGSGEQEKVLAFLKKMKDEKETGSEIYTGRISASRDIITPTLIADQIFAKSIKADSIEGLEIYTNQISDLGEKYQQLSGALASSEGNALEAAGNMLKIKSAQVALTLDVLGKLSVNGGMIVGGDAEFRGETVFAKLATFMEGVVFGGTVEFASAPTFSADTAGFALIGKGQREVDIQFETPYEFQPVISASLSYDRSVLLDDAKVEEETKKDSRRAEEYFVDAYFESDTRYVIVNKSQKGFTIRLNKPASQELQFSWIALSVKKAHAFSSDEEPVSYEEEKVSKKEEPEEEAILEEVVAPQANEEGVVEEAMKEEVSEIR